MKSKQEPLREAPHDGREGNDRLGKLDAAGSLVLLVVVAPVAIIAFWRNLEAAYFWFDEAGQYLMATGRSHYSSFVESSGSLVEGLRIAQSGSNMDPPGFTVLVRGWIDLLGSRVQVVRALPMVFFFGTVLVAYITARKVFELPRVVALLVPIAVLANGLPLNYAFEVRAFSIEMLSVLLIFLVTFLYLATRRTSLLVLTCIAYFLLPLMSRYTTLLAVAASLVTALAADILMRRQKERDKLGIPLLMACALLSLGVLVWYAGILVRPLAGMPYTEQFELEQNRSPAFVAKVVIENFATGPQMFTGLFALVCAVVIARYFVRAVGKDKRRSLASFSFPFPPWGYAFAFVIAYEIFASLLSVVGLSPWLGSTRWSIGLTSIAVISAFGLANIALRNLNDMLVRKEGESRIWSTFVTLLSSFCFALALARTVGIWNLLTGVIVSLVVVVAGAIIFVASGIFFRRRRPGSTREELNSFRAYVGGAACIIVTIAVVAWVSFFNLAPYSSERLTSTLPNSIADAALSVDPESRQIWHVQPWLWPTFRFIWETETFELPKRAKNADARQLETSVIATDEEVRTYIQEKEFCIPGTTSFLLLSGTKENFPSALTSARSHGLQGKCALTVASDPEKQYILMKFSASSTA